MIKEIPDHVQLQQFPFRLHSLYFSSEYSKNINTFH